MLKEFVLFVIKNLRQINISMLKHVQNIAGAYWRIPTEIKIKKITFENNEEMTYNLHVDKYNNFPINNGLIVHNSIAAHRYALETLSKAQGKPSILSGTKSEGKKEILEVLKAQRKERREIIKKQVKQRREENLKNRKK